jgi:general secretion pathway protein G
MATRNKGARGFSLIELVIVITVIAILAALLAPTILGQIERARISRAKSDVNELAKIVARIRNDSGGTNASCLTDIYNIPTKVSPPGVCSPSGSTPDNACTTANIGQACWGGPYTTVVTNDPWNNAYTATMDPNTFAVTIFSNGPNGVPGDGDDITFIQ